MDRDTAEQLMKLYHQLGEPLNHATEIIGGLPDQEEQKLFRRPVGHIMGLIWTDLMRPIVQQFPELYPEK